MGTAGSRQPAAGSSPGTAPVPDATDLNMLRDLGYFGSPPLDSWGTLVVDIVDENGLADERAMVVGVDCPGFRGPWFAGHEGRLPVGPCTVRAWRRDGALFARSEPVTVEVGPTDPAYVLLELASARTGGIGVRFMPDEAGMRVVEVVPDSPAEEAGLSAGDLVLDVDGQPTADMNVETFVSLMTGAEGSDVTFTVGWTGDTGLVEETVTVARRFLDG